MTRDQELWGMAAILMRQHRDRTPLRVAEWLGELALSGEADGVALWQEVARRMDVLMAGKHQA